ncbi:hypothetical protein [Pseudokineococcus sp. 1T1Z-3]|uniref:hypothetical protein n=1 Tax=Pseudokineococcus sp. 1T1Z-3 TaxID=3132745 RepID=UPI0030A0161C
MRKLLGDRPGVVNILLVGLVAIHLLAGRRWSLVDVASTMATQPVGNLLAAFASVGLLASLTAGFAGVVVIFGLSQESTRFVELRHDGGAPLQRNWVTTVTTSLAGAFLVLTAVALTLLDSSWAAVWVAEVAVLWNLHGALRLVWLLKGVMRVVAAKDREALTLKPTIDVDELFMNARAPRK